MKILCPTCKSPIPASRLNVETDVAVCDQCNEAHSISALLAEGHGASDLDLGQPPSGTWLEDHGESHEEERRMAGIRADYRKGGL